MPPTGVLSRRRSASSSRCGSRSSSGVSMDGIPEIAEDLRDLLRAFIDHDVRFLVVVGYALAVHGHPRATGDLDVWVECSAANAERTYAALRAFGAPLGDLTLRDLVTPGTVFQIG